jgi:hypothetical protein
MTHRAAFWQYLRGRPAGNYISGTSSWLIPYLIPVVQNLRKRYEYIVACLLYACYTVFQGFISIQNVFRQPTLVTHRCYETVSNGSRHVVTTVFGNLNRFNIWHQLSRDRVIRWSLVFGFIGRLNNSWLHLTDHCHTESSVISHHLHYVAS